MMKHVVRTRHDIFEAWKAQNPTGSWKDYWHQEWQDRIRMYALLQWHMIPIAVRGKRPIAAQKNYDSHGVLGPYLKAKEALYWAHNDFNLAVCPNGRWLWCDIDNPDLFHDEWLKGLVMQTPRGYGVPVRVDRSYTEAAVEELKMKGYDFRGEGSYELVPNSETCFFDHHLEGSPHNLKQCVKEHHDYRVREFITPLSNPMLRLGDLIANI